MPRRGRWGNCHAIVKPTFEHCSNGIATDAVILNDKELSERVAYVLAAEGRDLLFA